MSQPDEKGTGVADLTEYARRRVVETCAAQGLDVAAPESVRDVVASLIGGGPDA